MALRRIGFGRQNLLAAVSTAAMALVLSATAATPLNLPNGWSDAFGSEAGVDVSAAISGATGTAIGNMTEQGGIAAAFDGNQTQTSTGAARKSNGTDNAPTPKIGGYLGKDWGSGNTRTITGVAVIGTSNDWINNLTTGSTITIELQGSTDNFSASTFSLGSFTFTDTLAGTLHSQMSGFTTTTAYRYHRVVIKSSGTFSGGGCGIAEVVFYEGGAGSTNYAYDAGNDWYAPTTTGGGVVTWSSPTVIGNFNSNQANAFNNSTSDDNATAAFSPSGSSAWLGVNLGGSPSKVTSVTVYGTATSGFAGGSVSTLLFELYASNSSPASDTDGTLLGSTASFSDSTSNNQTITNTLGNTNTDYQYIWVKWVSTSGSDAMICNEFRLTATGTPQDMSVRSISRPSPVGAPAAARLLVEVVENEAITVNTDLVAKISTDGGATWHTCTLVAVPTSSTAKTYVAANENLSDAGGGDDIVVEVEVNGKNVAYSGYTLELAA